jgi:hypothetical protein
MKKDELIAVLQQLENEVKQLEKAISRYDGAQIKQQTNKENVQKTARKWFEIEKQLAIYNLPIETITKYHKLFDDLLHMGFKDTRKTRYAEVFDQLRESYSKDVVAPIYKFTGDSSSFTQLDAILDSLTEEEKPLMKEAIDCAKSGYLRATVILGWAAAINRLHKVVENFGYDKFNKMAEEMNKSQTPRFRRASKANAHIQYLSDLQTTVFDNSLLWVLEYWGLLEYNQHERLTQCFVMRKGCAHPSLTTVSPENVASFYSDLKTIIFDNVKFRISDSANNNLTA